MELSIYEPRTQRTGLQGLHSALVVVGEAERLKMPNWGYCSWD